ncbi:site-specific integrase [Limosilactobacillus ingluviei]|uniref:site-specific integrase n=1 Tax=Limosilactobacillus ingluviei TaxID=148604 RepID=UPI0024B9EA1A|nr:site-specific integrase [Limosilactobacillus ingluviei]
MASFTSYSTKKGKRWRVDYYDTNHIKHTKRGFTTKSDAQHWHAQYIVDFERTGYNQNDKITYAKVYERYFIEDFKRSHRDSTSLKTMGYFKHYILPSFGNSPISKITSEMCQKAVYQWAERFKYVNKIGQYAAQIFKIAIKHHLIHENPMRPEMITYPRRKPTDPPKGYDSKTAQLFQAALIDMYKEEKPCAFTFIWLLLHTGLRKGEVLALQWQDINYENHYIRVRKGATRNLQNKLVVGSTKNESSKRKVPVDPETLQILKRWESIARAELSLNSRVQWQGQSQLLFTNPEGGVMNPSRPNKWINNLTQKYQLPHVTPHELRHTYGTLLIEINKPVTEVAALLGHSSVETTMKNYIDIHSATSSNAANDLADFLR